MNLNNIPEYQPNLLQPQNCPVYFQEIWTEITPDSDPRIKPNSYLVSTYGRVYSLLSNKFIEGEISCWGYKRITLQSIEGKHIKISLHRIIMIEFCKVPGYKTLQVNHMNTNKLDNVIWNLEWTTGSENSLYSYKDGCRTAPNTDNYSISNKSYISNTINDIPEKDIKLIEKYLSEGLDLLTIHRRTKYSMTDINKIKYKMNGISVNNIAFENKFSEFRLRFTDEQIHAICKYFQDHKDIKYNKISDLYRDCLYELFGIEYNTSLFNAMSRYYKRKYRHDITDLYDY